MSFFGDLFGGADAAAQAQIQGIQQGQQQAATDIGTGNTALTTNYAAALQPFTQNYTTAQQGVGALTNALGLGGPAGNQSALTALRATPGYQFALDSGNAAVNAGAAASGQLASGNQLLALQKQGMGIGDQTYNNYVGQLQPFLGASQNAAAGIGSVNTGLGSGLNANQTTLANIDNSAGIGIGNANASADLADQSLGLGLLGGGLTALTGGLGGLGGIGGIGSSLMGGVGQAGAALTGGGVGTFNAGFGAAPTFSLFSDERLKEDIEPVGELYDGTNVYRYKYIGDATPRIGVMAQEIAEDRPEAVHDIGGWLAVDYGAATNRAADLARFLDAA